MKHARSIFTALCCASLCLVSVFAQAQQAQPASNAQSARPATKNLLVGVVDLRAVLQNHPTIVDEIPALTMQMQEEQVALSKAKDDADKNVARLQKEYNSLIGSPEFEDKVGVVRKEFSDAEFKAFEAQKKLVAKRTQLLFKAYEDLQQAIETVAKQNGIIIVHSKVKLAVPDNASVSREAVALEEADQNTIVWNHPACDITEQVKAQLAVIAGTPKQNAESGASLDNLGAQAMSARASAGATSAAKQPTAAPVANRTANTPAASQRR
ncbi:MAG: OmpH family outer membrane protein [Thermoguttaceae bacterium]|nr:OmpH family outer membrane protein [Thermoguttaceae bacterium]